MNRRTFDIVIPILYILALLVVIMTQGATVVGATATIGLVVVLVYFLALRPKSKV